MKSMNLSSNCFWAINGIFGHNFDTHAAPQHTQIGEPPTDKDEPSVSSAKTETWTPHTSRETRLSPLEDIPIHRFSR
ncbi:MAG: hypothetical protein AAFY84_02235 [Pseudomonadota bacterium]